MARKKSDKVYPDDGRRVSIINLKGSVGYQQWLSDVAEESRIPASVIFRDAVKAWAKANGYQKPPEI